MNLIEVFADPEIEGLIHFRFHKGWTINDAYAAVKACDEIIPPDKLLASIADHNNSGRLPVNVFSGLINILKDRKPTLMVVAGPDTMTLTLVTVIRKLVPKFRSLMDTAKTVDEARAKIRTYLASKEAPF
jgi:hypothetical protein